MVDMAMGQEDLFHREALFFNCAEDNGHIAARVDDSGLVGGRAPQECAVLLQWCHRHDGRAQRQVLFAHRVLKTVGGYRRVKFNSSKLLLHCRQSFKAPPAGGLSGAGAGSVDVNVGDSLVIEGKLHGNRFHGVQFRSQIDLVVLTDIVGEQWIAFGNWKSLAEIIAVY